MQYCIVINHSWETKKIEDFFKEKGIEHKRINDYIIHTEEHQGNNIVFGGLNVSFNIHEIKPLRELV